MTSRDIGVGTSPGFLIAVASAVVEPLKAPQAPQRESNAERGLIPLVFDGVIVGNGSGGGTGCGTGWLMGSGRILI